MDEHDVRDEPEEAVDALPARRSRPTKQWSELSTAQKRAVVGFGVVEVVLVTVSQLDLLRRPSEQVRGPKPVWFVANFVNVVGPVSYFTLGRKRG